MQLEPIRVYFTLKLFEIATKLDRRKTISEVDSKNKWAKASKIGVKVLDAETNIEKKKRL